MITVNVMHINSVDYREHDNFSVVKFGFQDSGQVVIFLPAGKSRALADAISAVLLPDMAVIGEAAQ